MGGHQVDDPLGVKFERYVYSGTHMCATHTHTHAASVIYLFIQQVATLSRPGDLRRLCNRLAWRGMKNKSAINLAINLLGLTVHSLPVTINIT